MKDYPRTLSDVFDRTTRDTIIRETLEEMGIEVQDPGFLQSFYRFLCMNADRAVTQAELADYMGFNRDYCGRLFRKYTGCYFGEVYIRVRMAFARALLTGHNYSIADISALLGYSSQEYFARVFRKETDMTPSQYRRHGEPSAA